MRSLNIHARIMLAALLPAISVVLILSGYFVRSQLIHLDEALNQRGSVIASQLAQAAEYGVFSGNTAVLQTLADALLQRDDVIRVAIYRNDGGTLVDTRTGENKPTDQTYIIPFTADILAHDIPVSDFDEGSATQQTTPLGKIQVELSKLSTLQDKQHILYTGLIISVLVLLLGGFFALQTGRSVSRPLQRLTHAVSAISSGELNTRVDTHSHGELGELEVGFNTMATTLQNAQRELQLQVDAATRELRETLIAVEVQNVELDLARKRALQISEEKTSFLANMSHEIRTPMNGLLGFIDLLLRTPLNAEQRDYTSTIRKSATNLLVIVNDILDFSKIESGKLLIDSQPFDLREALEDSVDLMAPVAHEKKLELVLLIYSDVPLHLFGDSNRIRQILLNLIGNAIKFTEQGSVIVRVMLDETEASQNSRAAIRFSVTDTGIGLTEQQKKQLFLAFSQLDSSPVKHHSGTGLGLFISKNLVEAMLGQIGIDSEPGKGSTFWFSLPLSVQHDVSVTADEQVLDKPASAIIFDAHPLSRLATRHPLEAWGFIVDEAADETSLFDLLDTRKYDLILAGLATDTEQHQYISKRLLQKLRKFQRPVIAMVNEIERDKLQEWSQYGASLCITKPARRDMLQRAVWQALQIPEEESAHFFDRRKTPRPVMPNLTGARFLLTDDNEINRKLIGLQLETLGVQVDIAINGEEAIWFAHRNPYDLILMDLHMPGMSGNEAATRIRNDSELNQSTPIIAITANIFTGESEDLLKYGINDCLIKPISEYSLWEVIKRWIGADAEENSVTSITLSATRDHQQILNDLLDMLIADLPDQRINLARAFENQEWKKLREHAHKLNGSAAYCQADKLQQAASDLEQAAHEKVSSEDIETAYVRCINAIEKLINNRGH